MRISSAFICAGLTFLWSARAQSSSVDAFLASESPIAKAGLLANIGPSGSKSSGAKAGVVIASPSQSNPDYLYTWTRDTSLVFGAIIDQFTLGLDTSLRGQVDNFVASQEIIQQISNPSGTISTGGLGEPKFNIDETAFTGAWGRPQRDGPALRANAMITWANFLLKQNNATYVTSTLWPTIKLDLDYVAGNWNQTTFDLWEEVSSSSFFTTAVQHRALRQGIALANRIGQTSAVAGYTAQANNLLCFLQSYWNGGSGYITANTGGGRSGKDANTVLASIHTFDAAAGCDSVTFQPCSDRALSNLLNYVNAFRSIYSINSGVANNVGTATGRYPEDSYMGGNPWYLTTLAVAEQLYDSLIVWKQQGSITITATSQPFFALFSPGIATGTISSSSSTFNSLTAAIENYADSFVAVVAKFTPSGGGLAEQYSRSNGAPVSAVDLTWSYAALLTAFGARNGVVPASWGAKGLTVPTTCSGNTGGGSGGGGTVSITFNVQATTVFGENIFLTGSIDSLTNWSPDNALALNANNYPIWSVTVNIPASTSFEYKYIRKFNGAVTWESDPNLQFTSPASGTFTINDVWR
ncbi:carbohydrate-binding module family 20 protein [Macrolepiota fuliginosa MF-IS2]|uniref:Glucoamylase n=1 Tax=Macrolepiota fuliginosa MF-IS2 TaxID=1400762 RepID=A0A9P5XNT0_9AGAR|nr:carbohydrate-binding module family 20 protein [Macrolepiota fuliginosa MF-IS2]